MPGRDQRRSAVYAAEALVHNVFDAPGVSARIAGTTLTVPPEAHFSSAQTVSRYVDDVLRRPTVRRRFPRAVVAVSVRPRRGDRSAHYEPGNPGVIAVPESSAGRWALRETVVLHELAHHLDDSDGPAHGRGFVVTLIDLVADVMGPEAGLIYRAICADSGVL